MPLAHPPGHAQVGFGEAVGVIGGVRQKIHFFCMDMPQLDADLGQPFLNCSRDKFWAIVGPDVCCRPASDEQLRQGCQNILVTRPAILALSDMLDGTRLSCDIQHSLGLVVYDVYRVINFQENLEFLEDDR